MFGIHQKFESLFQSTRPLGKTVGQIVQSPIALGGNFFQLKLGARVEYVHVFVVGHDQLATTGGRWSVAEAIL